MRKIYCPLQEGFRSCVEDTCMWFDEVNGVCQMMNIGDALDELRISIMAMRLQDEEKER